MPAKSVNGYQEATRTIVGKFESLQGKLDRLHKLQAQIIQSEGLKSEDELKLCQASRIRVSDSFTQAEKVFTQITKDHEKKGSRSYAIAAAQPETCLSDRAPQLNRKIKPVVVPSSSVEWLSFKPELVSDLREARFGEGPSYKSWVMRDLSNGLQDDFLAVSTHLAKLQSKPQSLTTSAAQQVQTSPSALALSLSRHIAPKANLNAEAKLPMEEKLWVQSKLLSSPIPESEGEFEEFTRTEQAFIKPNIFDVDMQYKEYLQRTPFLGTAPGQPVLLATPPCSSGR